MVASVGAKFSFNAKPQRSRYTQAAMAHHFLFVLFHIWFYVMLLSGVVLAFTCFANILRYERLLRLDCCCRSTASLALAKSTNFVSLFQMKLAFYTFYVCFCHILLWA